MNDRVVIAERLDDRSHHLIKQALMINPALDKCGLQQRRFFIQRDQDAVQIGRGIHNVPDPFDIVLILGRAVHDRLDLGQSARFELDAPVGTVGKRVNQIMVNPIQRIETFGHLKNFCQRLLIENVSVFDLQHNLERIRAPNRRRVLIMRLDKFMRLGQLFIEACHQIKLQGKSGKDEGDRRHTD